MEEGGEEEEKEREREMRRELTMNLCGGTQNGSSGLQTAVQHGRCLGISRQTGPCLIILAPNWCSKQGSVQDRFSGGSCLAGRQANSEAGRQTGRQQSQACSSHAELPLRFHSMKTRREKEGERESRCWRGVPRPCVYCSVALGAQSVSPHVKTRGYLKAS